MNGILLMIIGLVALGAGYLFYGGWLAKKWGINPKAKTPAYEFNDGVDYVPADRGVVFGHQFASIAGAGPINGPIQAAVFGWLPVFLWILIGGIFFGAVQDFGAMYASVRNKGQGLGTIVEKYMGKMGKKLFCIFCWLFCILVVAAFADVVAGTWNGVVAAADQAQANASTATTSLVFIAFAVCLGFILQKAKLHKGVNTAIAIVFLIGAIVIGLSAPVYLPASTWHIIIFIYILIASVVPVWALLQPRDYLNSYLLVAMIAAAVIGVFVANPAVNIPAITAFNMGGSSLASLNSLFPFMFVTVACGAISGFHSLVSSGTASKQIKSERDMQPVSYGAMIVESLLAVVSLIAVASFAQGKVLDGATLLMTPPTIFAEGVAGFLETLNLPHEVVFTLINLAVSAFALTSLDSVARVGRLSFQEFWEDADKPMKERSAIVRLFHDKYVATIATLAIAYFLAKAGYQNIWPLFGSSNQLLAVLALLACAVFFKRTKRLYIASVIPACLMTCVTFTALVIKILQLGSAIGAGQNVAGNALQLVFAVLITGLGISIVVQCFKSLAAKKLDAAPAAAA
jgi:carbon starvation protein